MRKMLAGTALSLMLGGAAFAQATDPAAPATDPAADPMGEMVTISVDGTETEVPMEQAQMACPDEDLTAAMPGEVACEITQEEADEAGIVVAEDVDLEDDDLAIEDDLETDTDEDVAEDEEEDE